jgi:predicted  nucleic acid-binding Zn-ribbon protein
VATPVELLVEVQKIDIDILKLRKESDDIPVRKEMIEARNAEYRKSIVAAQQELTAAQAKTAEQELEAQSQRQKITKLREQQMLLKTNKEFKAMEEEIAGAQEKLNGIEDREIALLEEIDEARARVGEAKGALAKAEEIARADFAELDERNTEIRQRLEALGADRSVAVVDIDPEWLKKYEDILENKKDFALAKIEHGVCSGCHLKVAPHVVHDARRGDQMVICSYCARLLY